MLSYQSSEVGCNFALVTVPESILKQQRFGAPVHGAVCSIDHLCTYFFFIV